MVKAENGLVALFKDAFFFGYLQSSAPDSGTLTPEPGAEPVTALQEFRYLYFSGYPEIVRWHLQLEYRLPKNQVNYSHLFSYLSVWPHFVLDHTIICDGDWHNFPVLSQ